MIQNYRVGKRIAGWLLAILLTLAGSLGVLQAFAEGGQPGDVMSKIQLTGMYVKLNGTTVYDLNSSGIVDIALTPDSTMIFDLSWKVLDSGKEYSFLEGDYFTIPIVKVDGLQLKRTYVSKLMASISNGDATEVTNIATGAFDYDPSTLLLTYTVTFTDAAANYTVESGTANGDAALSADGAELPISFHDGVDNIFTVVQKEIVVPGLPEYKETLESMNKRVISPAAGESGQLEMSTLVNPVPTRPGGSTYGIDWRMSFLDLAREFESGQRLGEGEFVIIEDTLSKNQAFSNFDQLTQAWASGFQNSRGTAASEPFFLEVPLVAYGENRIVNTTGKGAAGTIIKGSHFTRYTSANLGDAASIDEKVKQTPLSWGIETLSDGREKLVINLGRMGPGVTSGGLTTQHLSGTQTPGVMVDLLVEELLGARKQIVTLSGQDSPPAAEIARWQRVFDNDLRTLLYYWPGFGAEIAAGVGAASADADAIVAAAGTKSVADLALVLEDLSLKSAVTSTMPINAVVLHYRTILKDREDQNLANSASIVCQLATKTGEASYKHQFGDSIIATLRKGDVAFVKAERLDDTVSDGVCTESQFNQLTGIPQVQFQVYKADENKKPTGSPLTYSVDSGVYKEAATGTPTLTTDADGKLLISDLTPGVNYILKEVKGPDGYYTENKELLFSAGITGKYYALYNTPRMVKLLKKDDKGNFLAGAVFSIHKSDHTQLKGFTDMGGYYRYQAGVGGDTVKTPDGMPLMIHGLPDGSYYFKEVSAPPGYQLADTLYPFTLSKHLPAVTSWLQDAGSAVNRTIEAPKITVLKKSAEGSAEAPLRDVTFTLTGRSNGYSSTGSTGADGTIRFDPLPPRDFAGSYTLTETTPDGYQGISPVTFTVEDDGRITKAPTVSAGDRHLVSWQWEAQTGTYTLVIRNVKETTPTSGSHILRLYKVDSTTNARLHGAVFRIQLPDGSRQTVTTAAPSGIAQFTIPTESLAGQYSLVEMTAPDGYQRISDIRFTVDSKGVITLNRSYDYAAVVDGGISLLLENTRIQTSTVTGSYGQAGYTRRDQTTGQDREQGGNQEIPDTPVPLASQPNVTIDDNPVPLSPPTGDSALPGIIACGLALVSALVGAACCRRRD